MFYKKLFSLILVLFLILGIVPVVFSQGKPVRGGLYNLSDYEKLTGKKISRFNEAPILAELVKQGKLPSVEKRLPEDPLVIEPVEEIGRYGGELRSAALGPAAFSDIEHAREFYFFRPDSQGKGIQPNIAKKYEVSRDGRTVIVYLRKGMKWSDGEPFTVDDILFWWEDIILNNELTPVKPTRWMPGGKLAKFSKIDDYTVRITFAVPFRPIIGILGYFSTGQNQFYVPKHYLKKWHIKYNPDANKLAKDEGLDAWYKAFQFHSDVGAAGQDPNTPVLGPWVLERRTIERRVYVRNPYFCAIDPAGNQLPYIDRLVVDIVGNTEVATMKLINGELTHGGLAVGGNMEDFTLYKENEKKGNYRVLLWTSSLPSEVAFGFNRNHPDPVLRKIFQDSRFSIAMSLAINRGEINEFAYLGTGTPMQATVHLSCSFYKEEWGKAYAEYDPKKANQLLDEMGLDKRDKDGYRLRPDGKTLAITIPYVEGAGIRGVKTVCELVKSYWEKVGIKVALVSEERSLYVTRGNAGLHDVGVWSPDRMLELRCFIPGMTKWTPNYYGIGWAVKWGLWWDTRGKSGEEPDRETKAFFNALDRWYLSVTDKEYKKRAQEAWDFQARNLYLIGTVGMVQCPVIITNKLRNVPEKVIWGDDLSWWNITKPEQWFFKP